MKNILLIAWGAPFVLVILSVVLFTSKYTSENFCGLQTQTAKDEISDNLGSLSNSVAAFPLIFVYIPFAICFVLSLANAGSLIAFRSSKRNIIALITYLCETVCMGTFIVAVDARRIARDDENVTRILTYVFCVSACLFGLFLLMSEYLFVRQTVENLA